MGTLVPQGWKSSDCKIQLRGRIQILGERYYDPERKPESTLSIPMVRLAIKYDITSKIAGEIEADFSEKEPVIKDAYVKWKASDIFRLFVGLSKKPLSNEEMTSYFVLPFVKRSETNDEFKDAYSIGRDIGIMAYGSIGNKSKFKYYIGIFNGSDYKTFKDDNNYKQRLIRVEQHWRKKLTVGTGVSKNRSAVTGKIHDYWGCDLAWNSKRSNFAAEYQEGYNDEHRLSKGLFIWGNLRFIDKTWIGFRYEIFDKNVQKKGVEEIYTYNLAVEGKKNKRLQLNAIYYKPVTREPYWEILLQCQFEISRRLNLSEFYK